MKRAFTTLIVAVPVVLVLALAARAGDAMQVRGGVVNGPVRASEATRSVGAIGRRQDSDPDESACRSRLLVFADAQAERESHALLLPTRANSVA
jgi:hypothetical protein